MKNPLRTGLIALVASAALVSARPAEGQQPEAKPAPVREAEKYNITVNFQGGTLQEYIDTLQKAAGTMPVNVVAPLEARKVELPSITLRNVNIYTALSAISSAFESDSQHRFGVEPIGGAADATYAIAYRRVDRSVRSPFSNPQVMAPPPPAKGLEVYSIRDLLDPPNAEGEEGAGLKMKFEDILSAIEGAMQLLDAEDQPRLLFHKETGLLIVGGTQYQTQVVGDLLMRIRDDLAHRWSREQDRKRQDAALERNVRLARTEVRLAELEVQQAKDRLARVEQLVQQGVESSDAMGKATLDFERAKARLERLLIELEAHQEGLPKRAPTPKK